VITSIIPATQETEAGGLKSEASFGKNKDQDPI
jgi:hypothetical protein